MPRESTGNAMVHLGSGSPRLSGFSLLGDPRFPIGITIVATACRLERIAIHGFGIGIRCERSDLQLADVAVSGCSSVGAQLWGGELVHTTLAGNQVGLALFHPSGTLWISRSIVAANASADVTGVGALAVTDSFLGSVAVGLTTSGTRIHREDPLLVDATNGDLRLRPGSPAIGAAGSAGDRVQDLDGNPRGIGGAADVGACEAGALALRGGLTGLPARVQLTMDLPAGHLGLVLVGVPDQPGPATPFGRLLMSRSWFLPLATDGSFPMSAAISLVGVQLGFQAVAIDPQTGTGSLCNLVLWTVL
jgi:hypothetical protein